jgi:hypothetical protein
MCHECDTLHKLDESLADLNAERLGAYDGDGELVAMLAVVRRGPYLVVDVVGVAGLDELELGAALFRVAENIIENK